MKKIAYRICCVFTALLFIIGAVNTARAANTSSAAEGIDLSRDCSLTLTYDIEGEPCKGLEIECFRIAEVSENYQYSMTGVFAEYPVYINGIKSQSEWNEVLGAMSGFIAANNPHPTASGVTGADGVVCLSPLPAGIYYVRWTGNDTGEGIVGFNPFLIAVPGLGDDGRWIYDVNALPKPAQKPEPKQGYYTLAKLWKDSPEDAANRPDEITVAIYKNGQLSETVTLSEAQDWAFRFAGDLTENWDVVELNPPDGYSISVIKNGYLIQLINTRYDEPEDPHSPETGDTSNLRFWIFATAASGVMLIILALVRHRKDRDEDDLE